MQRGETLRLGKFLARPLGGFRVAGEPRLAALLQRLARRPAAVKTHEFAKQWKRLDGLAIDHAQTEHPAATVRAALKRVGAAEHQPLKGRVVHRAVLRQQPPTGQHVERGVALLQALPLDDAADDAGFHPVLLRVGEQAGGVSAGRLGRHGQHRGTGEVFGRAESPCQIRQQIGARSRQFRIRFQQPRQLFCLPCHASRQRALHAGGAAGLHGEQRGAGVAHGAEVAGERLVSFVVAAGQELPVVHAVAPQRRDGDFARRQHQVQLGLGAFGFRGAGGFVPARKQRGQHRQVIPIGIAWRAATSGRARNRSLQARHQAFKLWQITLALHVPANRHANQAVAREEEIFGNEVWNTLALIPLVDGEDGRGGWRDWPVWHDGRCRCQRQQRGTGGEGTPQAPQVASGGVVAWANASARHEPPPCRRAVPRRPGVPRRWNAWRHRLSRTAARVGQRCCRCCRGP